MVIILSSTYDAHIPYVTKHLQTDFLLLDAGSILKKQSLTYFFDENGIQVIHNGKPLKDVGSIWLRRPRSAKRHLDIPVQDNYKDYCADALDEHISQLYAAFPSARWVSEYQMINRSNIKIRQLMHAQKVGLAVPASCITSSSVEAESFTKEHEKVIVKPLSRRAPLLDENKYLLPMTVDTSIPHMNFKNLFLAPSIFQQAIEAVREIRVTVVGTQVFAAQLSLSDAKEKGTRDIHLGYIRGKITCDACQLPNHIADQCVKLVKNLGLQFGAIDLLEDMAGKIWFIEINPNGQWAFVEQETGQPIGKAIARLLETPLLA